MKRFQVAAHALTIIIMVSSTALAGNIGGMRTSVTTNTDGMTSSTTGNIGGLRTEDTVTTNFSAAIAGNIGGLVSLILGATSIP